MFALRHLPFPEQIGAIDAIVADGRGRLLVDELAGFADHQPLAHAVAALARRGDIDARFADRLAELLLAIADPGLRRVLRALDDLDQVPRAFAGALAAAAGRLPVARIAATSLVDRWLKSAAPDLRAARAAGVLESCRELIRAGRVEEMGDELLAGIRGADHAELAALADRNGMGDGWRARLGRFAAAVIGALEAQPRSLSQASAEELLARQVYTDPGHFLVELLQNADDAGARSFQVTIEDDRITVEHDGVPFDARDVVGVLSIGQTTKTVDQIGFFGVGFKSVYEICERPQIYSGPFAFEIADVSIPRPLATRSGSLAGRTVLVLPLRDPADPERSPDRLHERVSSLPAEVLMTLDHIERIESTRGARRRSLRREVEPGRVQLVEDGVPRTYAVERATARYTGHRDAHRAEVTPILVAVALDDQGRAAPVAGPTIFSHLPTKERSGLRFLVHARFDVPLDRERLDLSSPWNRWALTEAAPLFGRLIARLAAGGPAAALAVVPLPEEVAHDAYRELAEVAATDLARAAILPGAAGELLAPRAALTVDDPRVARALAGVEVVDGRRPCAPLAARETAVARMLGARPLHGADIVAVIAREAGAAGSFAAPWGAAGLAALAEVLGADPAADLSPLRDARFLPDHRGGARLPSEILRADGELRALLAPVRPLVADELAGPGSHRFLDRVGARVARTGDLVGELVHGDRAAAVVAAAGSSRVISHLAAAPPGELGDVPSARVVPSAGDTLAAIGEVWLTGEGPLADAVRGLASAPPLCDRQFERDHQAQLRRLGARSLGLPALVDLVSRGELAVTAREAGPFHAAIEGAAGELGPALSGRLAAAAIFPDEEGIMRALVGGRDAALIADDDEVRALWSGPWLRRDVASLAYVRRLGVEPIGPDAVARAVARGELGGQRRRPAFVYLAARGPRLSTERVDELAIAPIWPDAGGRLRPLAELRRDSEVPSVAELYRLWPRAATVEPDDLPGSAMALARAIGLEHVVVEPGLATAIEDLLAGSSAPPGAPFRGDPDALDLDARPDLAAAVIALLGDAAGELPRARLERALEAPVYAGTDGVRRRLGRWGTPSPERCHRGADGLHRALAAGRYPVLDPGQERALAGFLDACGLRPATVIDLIGAVGVDGEIDEASAGAVRAALVAARAELDALEPRARSRLAHLSIWPTADGRQLPARGVLRGAALDVLLPATASEWRAGATGWALLSEAAEPDAARLAGVVDFADPIAALAAAVDALALPGAALTAQAPLLADPARVAEVAAVFFRARLAELPAEALPVGVDADGNLVARRLMASTPDEAELARGLSLRRQIAHPDWARRIDAAAPGALERLSLRQLVAALQTGSPDPVMAADHPFLASPERRRILHEWLAARARDIAEDGQARGALGRAAVILSAGGWLRPPRDLLHDPDLPDLGIDWYPAAEVPLELRAWLRATYRPGGKQLAPLVEHLLAAGEAAIAAGDGARLADILEHLARSLGADLPRGGAARSPGDPTGGPDEELIDGARRFKLRRRLRVEDDGGHFARPRSLLALDPVGWDLVSRFAERPPARVSPRYRDREPILRLCRAAGAGAELDEIDLERALAGDRRPGIDSTIALSCYLALVATRRPDLRRRLRLDERAWVADRSGAMRRPGELYWPDDTLEELIGLEDHLFPAPELAHRVPRARGWLGLRAPDQVALVDVAAHVIELRAAGREVSDPVLTWLDDGLAAGRLGPTEVRDALVGCAFLRDAAGLPRLAEHLVLEGARPLFGDRRGDFPDGRRLPRLTAALRIARRPGKREVAGFLAEIADEVAAGVDPLAADPALADRLPRCLDVLVEAGGRGPSPLPIVCQGANGYVLALLPDAAAAIDLDGDAPLSPVIPDAGDPEAWRSYLRSYGVGPRREQETVPKRDTPLAPQAPSTRPQQEPEGRGLLDRIAGFFRGADRERAGDDRRADGDREIDREIDRPRDDDREPDADRPADRAPPRPPDRAPSPATGRRAAGGRSGRSSGSPAVRPDPASAAGGAVDQRRWFRPDRRLDPQLRASPDWLDDRRHAASFGVAHSPRTLPAPYLYAPVALFAEFDRRRQSWSHFDGEPDWRRGRDPAGRVALRGRLPGGAAVLPLPLYGRILSVEDPAGARLVAEPGGAAVLFSDGDTLVTATIEIGAAPDFSRAVPASADGALLRPTVADDELPDEVLGLVERLHDEQPSAFERATDIRDFVRERYAYDPSYLEDPAVAAWLRQRSRGRSNEHVAALHAGADPEHLGRGVCYELNLLACELLRRAGVPAVIATGWTLDRGFVDEPDHLFAMALLDAGDGPRWLPVDASTTRAGRPLHAGHRPPGPWRAAASGQVRAPGWARSGQRADPDAAPPRPPVAELLRVARYLEETTGRHLGSRDELAAALRELLRDPDRAASLAALLGGDPE